MRFSMLSAVAVALCAFATANDASAVSHNYNCKLTDNSANYYEIPASLSGGYFTNKTGGSRYAMCPVDTTGVESNFLIYGTPTNMTCWLKTITAGGLVTVYGVTSHVGNQWYWSLYPSGAVEMQCYLPNNGQIWQMSSY